VRLPLGWTKTPKPFSSLHQIVNCLARGTAASTWSTWAPGRGLQKNHQKLTTRTQAAGDNGESWRNIVTFLIAESVH